MLCLSRVRRRAQLSAASLATVRSRGHSHHARRVPDINSLLQSAESAGASSTPRDVVVVGHVRTVRTQKRRSFVELGDGSTTRVLQALLEPSQASGLGTGAAVLITGVWQPCPPGKEQSHELHAKDLRVLGKADAETYPLQKKFHTPEYLRTIPHLRLRVPFNAAVARLRSEVEYQLSSFYRSHGFVRVHPPIITASDAEGAGETFSVIPRPASKSDFPAESSSTPSSSTDRSRDFFSGPRYLTVSSQLHLEAFVHEHPRVWTLSPTFRAEKSDTNRHLSEFYMLEAELRTESLVEVMDHAETMIRQLAMGLRGTQVVDELLASTHRSSPSDDERDKRRKLVDTRWQGLCRSYWPRITYTDAMRLLAAAAEDANSMFKFPPSWESGLQLEHERYLASEVGQGSPVFVTDYPRSLKPFYMLSGDPDAESSQETAACFDLLFPDVCEVMGGSLREHRADALEQSMMKSGPWQRGLSTESSERELSWYLDLRKYGSIPHGGYGLGFDRLIGYLAGIDNIRDVVPWPRYYGRCDG